MFLVTLGAGVSPGALQSSAPQLPERLTAFAVSPGGPRTSSVATPVDIVIRRWSSDDETRQLMTALKERGADAMLGVLRDLKPVGTINTPGRLAYDLRYAQSMQADEGGRHIVLATDRQISAWEAMQQPRSVEYPFTFIELRLDDNRRGEGKLAVATRIIGSRDGHRLQLENYALQPIALNDVHPATQ